MSGSFILYLVLGCLVLSFAVAFGLGWLLKVKPANDDGFRGGERRFRVL